MSRRLELIREAGEFLVAHDLADPGTIERHDLARETGDAFVSAKGWEYVYMKDFCWPVQAEAELRAVVEERARLRKAFDDSMSLVFGLRNKISRGEV